LIIYNKCGRDQADTVEAWTKRFLQAQDPDKSIQNAFYEVHCTTLPVHQFPEYETQEKRLVVSIKAPLPLLSHTIFSNRIKCM